MTCTSVESSNPSEARRGPNDFSYNRNSILYLQWFGCRSLHTGPSSYDVYIMNQGAKKGTTDTSVLSVVSSCYIVMVKLPDEACTRAGLWEKMEHILVRPELQ